jgi:hypothetical protein
VPSPEHGSPPTEREAMEREKILTSEYPLFEKVSIKDFLTVVRTIEQ